jgi:hypothetical protein
LRNDNTSFDTKSTSRGAGGFGRSFPILTTNQLRSIVWRNRRVAWPLREQIHNGHFKLLINWLNSPFATCIRAIANLVP